MKVSKHWIVFFINNKLLKTHLTNSKILILISPLFIISVYIIWLLQMRCPQLIQQSQMLCANIYNVCILYTYTHIKVCVCYVCVYVYAVLVRHTVTPRTQKRAIIWIGFWNSFTLTVFCLFIIYKVDSFIHLYQDLMECFLCPKCGL